MKKILIIILLFMGCVPNVKHIPEIYMTIKVDFTKYSKKGFLFTPNKYQGKYHSMGIITLLYYPEANMVTSTSITKGGSKSTVHKWEIEEFDSYSFLDSIYSISVSMGADAFTELVMTDAEAIRYGEMTTNPVSVKGIKIYGFAIKRKDTLDK